MAYTDLLVHLDDSKGCAKRVDAAVRLAGQHGAHLTGLYPIVEIPLLNYIREQIPEDVQARMEAEAQRQAKTALKGFRQAAEPGQFEPAALGRDRHSSIGFLRPIPFWWPGLRLA